ncbi:hypothetical protein V8J36_11570 [Frigidibacter sp. MR17.14]|uniref:hypothetical protein n=1 Tax=Frigidibacter sp. MR17.14 TaxID=3126509 RepID=UPI003012F8F0
MIPVAVVAALGAGGAAIAQADPMETQRCVWACLANSAGASDPAYHACVAARCDDGSAGAAPPAQRSLPVAQPPSVAQPSTAPGWRQLQHPVLGPGIFFVQADGEAIGLGCSGRPEAPIAFGWTAGHLPDGVEAVAVIGDRAAVPLGTGAGVAIGGFCAPPVQALLGGSAIAILPGRATGVLARGGVQITGPDGTSRVLSHPQEAFGLGGVVIPGAPAAAGLRALALRCLGRADPPPC